MPRLSSWVPSVVGSSWPELWAPRQQQYALRPAFFCSVETLLCKICMCSALMTILLRSANDFIATSQTLSPQRAGAEVVVPKSKVGVTPGGVKYFDKDPNDSCSPFNPCSPQAGDIVKIKYKSFLSNGAMYDSSEGPGRKPLAAKYKASPPQMIPGWVRCVKKAVRSWSAPIKALSHLSECLASVLRVVHFLPWLPDLTYFPFAVRGFQEEALDGMKQGQTRIIQVPPEMAYGEKGIKIPTKDGSVEYLVPPGERLQFELTLVQVALPPP